jgi:hypothetical protein
MDCVEKKGMKSAILLFFAFTLPAQAAVKFGAEFEMSNQEVWQQGIDMGRTVNTPKAVTAQWRLLQAFTKECKAKKECRILPTKNSYGVQVYRVEFKDGFWVQISTDVAVVEIQTKPSTVTEYNAAKPHLERLFKAGAETGLTPDPKFKQGGHIHMDFASAFGDDHRLFRNFLVDFMNHQELGGGGVFGSDPKNAPHLSLLTDEQKSVFMDLIDRFDRGEIKTGRELAKKIIQNVYHDNPAHWSPFHKYHALNLSRVPDTGNFSTVEFRALSAQQSPDEFLKQTGLFEARLEFLKKLDRNLPLVGFRPLSLEGKVGAFRSYVEESGLDWNDYKPLLRNGAEFADTPALTRIVAEQIEPLALPSSEVCRKFFSHLLNLN